MTNYIALAIPLFFVFIALELFVAWRRKATPYRLTDSMIDLSSGTLQQTSLIFFTPVLLWAYDGVWQHRFIDWTVSEPLPWIVAFFGVDLGYYWWHRLSHESNFLWASHVQHHSSEEYNLSVALRQSITSSFTSLPFYLPLAVLGVPPIVYATTLSFSTLYQFWIHTDLVGRLGPFEWLFNTPSQHRVHHAVNPRYLDKNYAATLCIWDRLFGSFEPETDTPVYGLVKPLGSFNPLWVQLHRYVEVFRLAVAAPAWKDKLLVWVKGPEWSVPGLPPLPPPPEVTRETRPPYDPRVSRRMSRYLWLQLVVTMTGTFFLLFFQNTIPRPLLIGGALLVTWTLGGWGGLIEAKSWGLPVEAVRLLALAGFGIAAVVLSGAPLALAAAPVALVGVMAALLIPAAQRSESVSVAHSVASI